MEENALYSIDWKWLESQKRSPAQLVKTHMCAHCREQYKDIGDDEITGGTKVLKQIGKCCSGQEEFFSPGLPLLELVFRLFLEGANKPLNVSEILEQLKSRSKPRSLDLTEEKLTRLLDADAFYGLRRLPEAETVEAS